MKRLLFVLSGIVCILMLSGCDTDDPPPGPLRVSSADYQSTSDSQLAVAVDAHGIKYITRIECRTDSSQACRLIYEVLPGGAYIAYSPAAGYNYRNPDIAVTDSGLAIFVWQICPPGEPIVTRQCQSVFVRSDDLNTIHYLEVGTYTISAPLVVSRGAVIYAVHEVTVGTAGSALRYCRVGDALHPCYWVSDHPDDGVRRKDAAAAVSGAGSLHVAWARQDTTRIYSNGNYGALSADMAAQQIVDAVYSTYSPPAIAIEPDDGYLYIAFNSHAVTNDLMYVMWGTVSTNGTANGVSGLDMPSAKQWSVYGRPSVAARADRAMVAFSARNTDHPQQYDIYWAPFTVGSLSTPTRPFPTTLPSGDSACEPFVAIVDGWDTVGWHVCAFPPARGAVYFYTPPTSGMIIHTPISYAGRGGLDMAANGKYVAGVWNEVQTDGRIATWMAFNAYLSHLPVVVRK